MNRKNEEDRLAVTNANNNGNQVVGDSIQHQLEGNAFVSEMAQKTIKDFKARSRSRVLPRVARRI